MPALTGLTLTFPLISLKLRQNTENVAKSSKNVKKPGKVTHLVAKHSVSNNSFATGPECLIRESPNSVIKSSTWLVQIKPNVAW